MRWRELLGQLLPEPAPPRPYVHPAQYKSPEGVRTYSDGMHEGYEPRWSTRLIAAATLGLYVGIPNLLLGLMVAACFSRTAAWLLAALVASLALPAAPLRVPAVLHSYVFLCWRRYFKFSYLFETNLNAYEDYIIAQFPHGAFPLGALVGGTFMASEFPEYPCYLLAANAAFLVPLWRHVHAWLGTSACTKANFHRLLGLGVKGPRSARNAVAAAAAAAEAAAAAAAASSAAGCRHHKHRHHAQQQQQGAAGAPATAAGAAGPAGSRARTPAATPFNDATLAALAVAGQQQQQPGPQPPQQQQRVASGLRRRSAVSMFGSAAYMAAAAVVSAASAALTGSSSSGALHGAQRRTWSAPEGRRPSGLSRLSWCASGLWGHSLSESESSSDCDSDYGDAAAAAAGAGVDDVAAADGSKALAAAQGACGICCGCAPADSDAAAAAAGACARRSSSDDGASSLSSSSSACSGCGAFVVVAPAGSLSLGGQESLKLLPSHGSAAAAGLGPVKLSAPLPSAGAGAGLTTQLLLEEEEQRESSSSNASCEQQPLLLLKQQPHQQQQAAAPEAPPPAAQPAAPRARPRALPPTGISSGGSKLGVSVGLMVGGIAEMFLIRPDHERIKLAPRKGFVRVAVEHGVDILPVYTFGVNQVLDFGPAWLGRLSRRLRASLGLIIGVWGLPLPRRLPLLQVTGRPVVVGPPLRRDDPGFEARVDAVHAEFVAAIRRLYYAHRGAYGHGFEQRPLVIT